LIVSGLETRSAWNDVRACAPKRSSVCSFKWVNFQNTHSNFGLISALFIFAPLLIGAFVGAPLIGRELETGTFRYAWTQGAGRRRWAIATVVSGAAVAAALAGGLGALITWHDTPLWQAQITPRLQPSEFSSTGVVVIGWSLATYGVAVLGGLLWRRVVPALATAVLAMFAVAFATSKVRLHYLPPLKTSSLDYVAGSQTISQWWEKAGARVSISELNPVLRTAGIQQFQSSAGGKNTVTAGPGDSTDPVTYLVHHGYTQWTSYQPSGRYWTFQWIELSWLSIVAVVAIAATLMLLQRRDA
jgi:ABC-type transport system involved in multi-copper enzyme maturation permease subunit